MAEPLDLPERYEAPEWPAHGWRWHTSRTGASLSRVANYGQTAWLADALGPVTSGAGQITVVVDGQDSAAFARVIGRGCRRRGRFVVHASPRYSRAARAQSEVLRALGKHWDWAAQGGTATLPLLARVWLRAERARDLIVLRADQIHDAALAWLAATAVAEGVRLWLITSTPILRLQDTANGMARESRPADALAALEECTDCRDVAECECEDLSYPPPPVPVATGLAAVATVRRIRLLYDVEAAALATAAAILGCPHPDTLATYHAHGGLAVSEGGANMSVPGGASVAIPEYAQALLRGWAGQPLLPADWAHDVTSTYLTLRLEDAERHTGLQLLPPEVPDRLPYVPWHTRYDPGAQTLAELTRSTERPAT